MSSLQHLGFYRDLMARRTADDPKEAVGGMWEEIGLWQFDLMLAQGLKTHHDMLDLGCGSFRGGRHFLRYLQPHRYVGADISQDIITAGLAMLAEAGIDQSQVRRALLSSTSLGELGGQIFDFILAQSVFTHSTTDVCEELFASIARALRPGGRLVFTFNAGPLMQTSYKDFTQPPEYFHALATANGLEFTLVDYEPRHPRGLTAAVASRT